MSLRLIIGHDGTRYLAARITGYFVTDSPKHDGAQVCLLIPALPAQPCTGGAPLSAITPPLGLLDAQSIALILDRAFCLDYPGIDTDAQNLLENFGLHYALLLGGVLDVRAILQQLAQARNERDAQRIGGLPDEY